MTIIEDLATIKEELRSHLDHPYLMKYIEDPQVDEDKMTLLYMMFRENGGVKEIKPYVLTIMLVQIALDIHDTIQTQKSLNQNKVKERQLTVLAGDYYSSLYYRLLAKLPDIHMISLLAHAIQKMNEKKMAQYQNKNTSLSEKVEELQQIESLLLVHVGQALGLEVWNPIILEYFLIKRLYKEQKIGMNNQGTLLFHRQELSDDINTALDKIIIQKRQNLMIRLPQIPLLYDFLNDKLDKWREGSKLITNTENK